MVQGIVLLGLWRKLGTFETRFGYHARWGGAGGEMELPKSTNVACPVY
jgi:hypothetical protein